MRAIALVSAFAIAYCMAIAGQIIAGRWAHTLQKWNESFLVGLSVASTAFFPLSLLLHRQALNVMVAGLTLTGVTGTVLRVIAFIKSPGTVSTTRPSALHGLAPRLLVALLILLVVQFTVLNYRLTYLWDGYQIWATKAMVIFDRGELTQSLLTPHTPDLMAFPNCCDGVERDTSYPQSVPLFEALVAKSEGRFVWEPVKAIFPLFFASLLISTFRAARSFVPLVPALAASLLLGMVPAVATEQSVGGYADMPQAALLAGFLAAVFRAGNGSPWSFREPAPWLLGGVLLVKNEGSILFAVACASIALVWASKGLKGFLTELRRHAGSAVVVALCGSLRAIYILWMDLQDPSFGPYNAQHFAQAYSRLWVVPEACTHFMFNRADWGVFWPVFFLCVPVVLWKGRIRERTLLGGLLAALAMYTAIFYFTNWEVHLHIEQAYTRLLVHLSPAAALVTVIAYSFVAGRREMPSTAPAAPNVPASQLT